MSSHMVGLWALAHLWPPAILLMCYIGFTSPALGYGRYHFHFPNEILHVRKSASPKFGTWPPNKVFAGQEPASKQRRPCLNILEASKAQQHARGPQTRPRLESASLNPRIRDMRLSQHRGPWAWRRAFEASSLSLQGRSCLVGGFWPAGTLYGGQVPNFVRTCRLANFGPENENDNGHNPRPGS